MCVALGAPPLGPSVPLRHQAARLDDLSGVILRARQTEWGVADVVELCEVLPRFAALRTLDLSHNKIGPAGASALSEALKVNPVLTELNLFNNGIGVDGASNGAKAIAEALKVNPVLTKLDLQYNSLQGENAGRKAVLKAVKNRSGFELKL